MKNVAIVGCGSIARLHASVLSELGDVSLVGFADCIIEKAEEYVKEYGTNQSHSYPSLEEMLEQESIDVLHICTPHYLHVPMAITALKYNIHVFMEKPPAINREEFSNLKNIAKESRGVLGFCFQNRYNESTKAVEELLLSEEVGKILGGRAFVTWERGKEYYTESGWRGELDKEGGGCLMNQAIHTLDLLNRFMGGNPIHVQARIMNYHLSDVIFVEDTVDAYINYKNAIACFYATTGYACNRPIIIEISCENMTIRLEDSSVTCIYTDGRVENLSFYKNYTIGKDYWGTGHKACILDYYHCLESGDVFLNSLDLVEETFELVMNIYQSARKNNI